MFVYGILGILDMHLIHTSFAMDPRSLRYFINVADNRSFSRAAILLHIGQSALTRSVQKLEQELGVKLLRRLRTGVVMTRAGELLYRRSNELLERFSQIHDEVRSHAGEIAGNATVGVPAAVGQFLVPALLRHLARHQPGIRLRIVEGTSAENHDRLLTQSGQICLLYDPQPNRELVLQPIANEDMYLFGRSDKLSEVSSPCALEELENLPMILPTPPNSRRLLVEKTFKEQNLTLNIEAEVDSYVITRALLSEGLGYSLAPLSSFSDTAVSNNVAFTGLLYRRISWLLALAYHRSQSQNRVIQAVVSAITSVSGELMSSGQWKGCRLPS